MNSLGNTLDIYNVYCTYGYCIYNVHNSLTYVYIGNMIELNIFLHIYFFSLIIAHCVRACVCTVCCCCVSINAFFCNFVVILYLSISISIYLAIYLAIHPSIHPWYNMNLHHHILVYICYSITL